MRRSTFSGSRHSRRGVAAVEFALLLPLLCFLFVITVDFCRVYYYSITISNCARNGALFASADIGHAQNVDGIRTATIRDASNLDLAKFGVATWTDGSNSVSVKVTYPFTTITHFPGIPHQIDLHRTVQMKILPATPTFN